MVQPSLGNLVEIVLGDPRIPVACKTRRCFVFTQSLGVGELIDNRFTGCPIIEDGGSDPGLQDEPSTEVYTPYFVIVVIKAYITAFEFATDINWLFLFCESDHLQGRCCIDAGQETENGSSRLQGRSGEHRGY